MKKLVLIALMAIPTAAFAVTPGEVFSNIFELILNNINKDNQGNVVPSDKVLLKKNGNRILLARLFVDKSANGDTDSVNLPACGKNTANTRVDRVRLRIAEANTYVGTVRFTYENGTTATMTVDDTFQKGTNSSFVDIGANRCIRKIRVTGQAQGGNKVSYGVITVVGRIAN